MILFKKQMTCHNYLDIQRKQGRKLALCPRWGLAWGHISLITGAKTR